MNTGLREGREAETRGGDSVSEGAGQADQRRFRVARQAMALGCQKAIDGVAKLKAYGVVALALLTWSACDVPDPLDPSNPVDPAYEGDLPRTVVGPSGIAISATTPTSVSLSWTDNSSFEQGYRVRRSRIDFRGRRTLEEVIDLPPNTTTYVAKGLVGVSAREFVVAAIQGEGQVVPPADSFRVRYPAQAVRQLNSPEPGVVGTLSADTRLAFIPQLELATAVVDAQTGGVLHVARGLRRRIDVLDDGRATVMDDRPIRPQVSFLDRSGATSPAVLELPNSENCRFETPSEFPTSSSDGSRAIGSCHVYWGRVYVWDLSTGALVDSVAVQTINFESPRIQAVSPDGDVFVVWDRHEVSAYRVSTGERIWTQREPSTERVSAQVSEDGRRVLLALSGAGPTRIQTMDLLTGDLLAERREPFFFDLYDVRHGQAVYFSALESGRQLIRVVRLEDLTVVRDIDTEIGGGSSAAGARITPEGVTTLTNFNAVYRWDLSASWEPY